MLLLTVTEFRSNISKYLKMASTERIALKSPSGIFEIVPSKELRINPSPSNDPYFDNASNIEAIERGDADVKAGRIQKYSLDELKTLLNQ